MGYSKLKDWPDLVGRIVESAWINERRDVIELRFADNPALFLCAVGDCCSRSWFEHVEGVDALIGHQILRVVEREMPPPSSDAHSDVTRYYGWTIETARGRCDIEMRNESNGWYGGSVYIAEWIVDQYANQWEEPETLVPLGLL